MRFSLVPLTALCALGCDGHGQVGVVGSSTTDDPTETSSTTTDYSYTQTFTDCALPAPETYSEIALEYPGEEFSFDSEGNFVTAVDWADTIARMTRDGVWDFVVPYQSDELAGIDIMLNGDLVIADEANGVIARVSPEGGTSILDGSILSPNSIAVSPQDIIYTTAFDELYRIDPETLDKDLLARYPGRDLDGLAFSPDFKFLWFNQDDRGDIYRMELDEEGFEVETVFVVDFNLQFNTEIDGMTTDACGNLYVVRTDGKISRYLHDGTKQHDFIRIPGAQYASAIHFGSGLGGWERDHLYMMDRFGTLFDIPVGIPGAMEPHLE